MNIKEIAAVVVGFVLFILLLRSLRIVNGYTTLTTSLGDASPSEFFGVQQSTRCIPGPSADADYYTGESLGGFCGGQEMVHKLGHEYSITSGIGGSLLSD